jgi:hypothetical protein
MKIPKRKKAEGFTALWEPDRVTVPHSSVPHARGKILGGMDRPGSLLPFQFLAGQWIQCRAASPT